MKVLTSLSKVFHKVVTIVLFVTHLYGCLKIIAKSAHDAWKFLTFPFLFTSNYRQRTCKFKQQAQHIVPEPFGCGKYTKYATNPQ